MSKDTQKKEFEALLVRIIKEEIAKELKARGLLPEAVGLSDKPSLKKLQSAKLGVLKDFIRFSRNKFPNISKPVEKLFARIEELDPLDPNSQTLAKKHIAGYMQGRDAEEVGNLTKLADLFYDQKTLSRSLGGLGKKGLAVDAELDDAEKMGTQAYAGSLRAATSPEFSGRKERLSAAELEQGRHDWNEIGAALGATPQAAEQMFSKAKEKLQQFAGADSFDTQMLDEALEDAAGAAAGLLLQSMENLANLVSESEGELEGFIEAEVKKFESELLRHLQSTSKIPSGIFKIEMHDRERLFWLNLLTEAFDRVIDKDKTVGQFIVSSIYDELTKGLSQERLENAADKIKDLQRIFLITFSSKELEDQIPEHLKSEARAAAPDFLAVIDIIRNYINSQEHETTPLPEKLLRIFDELETAIEQLKQEDSQSNIGSIQDMISKSIFFPDKRTLARPAKNKPVSEPATSKSSV